MKTIVLLCMVVLAVPPPVVANAAPGAACSQIVKNLNDAVAGISGDATSYWAHRARFIDLIFGESSQTDPNAQHEAEQEKGQADAVKGGVPGRLASFKGLITAAQAQSCLSPTQLSAIVEPTIKQAKRVNFDQFPEELPFESSVDRGPPEMPKPNK
jgi:hypothetical protein